MKRLHKDVSMRHVLTFLSVSISALSACHYAEDVSQEDDSKEILKLVEMLSGDDSSFDLDIYKRLVEKGRRASSYLLDALASKDISYHKKMQVISILDKMKEEKLVRALKKLWLQDAENKDKWACLAIQPLAHLGTPEAVELLIEIAKEYQGRERDIDAVFSPLDELRSIKNPAAIPAFLKALDSDNTHIAITAIEVLGEMKVSSAVEPLMKVLKHNDPTLRLSATDALGNIGDKRSVAALKEALKNERDEYVILATAIALLKLGEKDGESILFSLVSAEPSWSFASQIAQRLSAINNPPIHVAKKLLEGQPWNIQMDVVKIIGATGSKEAISLLEEELKKHKEARENSEGMEEEIIYVELEILVQLVRNGQSQKMEDVIDLLDTKAPKVVGNTLKELTGQDFNTDKDAWSKWWKENMGSFRINESGSFRK